MRDFFSWFRKKQDRETIPMKSLTEQLVIRAKIFDSLPENQLNINYVNVSVSRGTSNREGKNGRATIWFSEVYDVSFSEEYQRKIEQELVVSESLRLISKEEIAGRKTLDGSNLGHNCILLYAPQIYPVPLRYKN
jgi:hypothetical protein